MPGGARLLAWIRSLPDHRLLDRLIGGRVWIVLIGTLLVGLVTVQLSLLKLNAGIGRAVERGAALEQSNAGLRASISELSNSERVVAAATALGYVVPLQGTPRYLHASASDSLTALSVMRVPLQSATTISAGALPTTGMDSAGTVDTTTTGTTTTTDPTTTTDAVGATIPSTPVDGTAPVATAPPATTAPPSTPTSSGAAGTTSPTALTTGSTAAGGATPPTTGSAG